MLAEATKTKEEEEEDAKKKRIEQQNALVAFLERHRNNLTRIPIDNQKLHAGSPLHFGCEACNADFEVPENYKPPREVFCDPCRVAKKKGWLENFLLVASRIDG